MLPPGHGSESRPSLGILERVTAVCRARLAPPRLTLSRFSPSGMTNRETKAQGQLDPGQVGPWSLALAKPCVPAPSSGPGCGWLSCSCQVASWEHNPAASLPSVLCLPGQRRGSTCTCTTTRTGRRRTLHLTAVGATCPFPFLSFMVLGVNQGPRHTRQRPSTALAQRPLLLEARGLHLPDSTPCTVAPGSGTRCPEG